MGGRGLFTRKDISRCEKKERHVKNCEGDEKKGN